MHRRASNAAGQPGGFPALGSAADGRRGAGCRLPDAISGSNSREKLTGRDGHWTATIVCRGERETKKGQLCTTAASGKPLRLLAGAKHRQGRRMDCDMPLRDLSSSRDAHFAIQTRTRRAFLGTVCCVMLRRPCAAAPIHEAKHGRRRSMDAGVKEADSHAAASDTCESRNENIEDLSSRRYSRSDASMDEEPSEERTRLITAGGEGVCTVWTTNTTKT